MEQHNEETEAVRLLLQTVREQTAKQLPAPEPVSYTHLDVYKRQKSSNSGFIHPMWLLRK